MVLHEILGIALAGYAYSVLLSDCELLEAIAWGNGAQNIGSGCFRFRQCTAGRACSTLAAAFSGEVTDCAKADGNRTHE